MSCPRADKARTLLRSCGRASSEAFAKVLRIHQPRSLHQLTGMAVDPALHFRERRYLELGRDSPVGPIDKHAHCRESNLPVTVNILESING
jgi:hypothetical protein